MFRHAVHPLEWIDTAPVRVEAVTEIAASPDSVWPLIADHDGWPRWFRELTGVQVTPDPAGLGAGRRVRIGRIVLDQTCTAWDVPSHFALAVTASNIPFIAAMAESIHIEPSAGGCLVTYRQGLQPRRGTRWLLTLISRHASRDLQDALDALRRLAEAA